jgi:hypothetical protein
MKYEIIEVSKKGVESVFYTGTSDKFRPVSWFESIVDNRNKLCNDIGYSYYLREVAA